MGLGHINRHTDLHIHEQQPIDRGFAYERVVHERELYLGLERQRNRHGIHDGGPFNEQTASPGYTYTYDNAGK